MAEVVHMIDSEVFLAFSTYATIVILKTMLMSPLTTYFRLRKKVRIHSSDGSNFFGKWENWNRLETEIVSYMYVGLTEHQCACIHNK